MSSKWPKNSMQFTLGIPLLGVLGKFYRNRKGLKLVKKVVVSLNYCNLKQSYYSTFLILDFCAFTTIFCGAEEPARKGDGSVCEKKGGKPETKI